MKNNTR